MTFIEFQSRFSTEKQIIDYYISIKYGKECACNHCGSLKVYQRPDRPRIFQCGDCFNDFSVFKDSIFENSKTDLRKWFYAIHLFLNGKKGISGLQLQREIGGSYKTSWRILKQIRLAMANKQFKHTFDTVVEIDETYMGGKPRKGSKGMLDTNPNSKRGRGTSKTPVVGIIDRTNKQVHARVALPNQKGQKLSGKQLLDILEEVTIKGATVITDEMPSYRILSRSGFTHIRIDHSKMFAKGKHHTNNIECFWGTLKRAAYGIYHSISVKYLQNYVDEFCFRYNNRFDPKMFDKLIEQSIKL